MDCAADTGGCRQVDEGCGQFVSALTRCLAGHIQLGGQRTAADSERHGRAKGLRGDLPAVVWLASTSAAAALLLILLLLHLLLLLPFIIILLLHRCIPFLQ